MATEPERQGEGSGAKAVHRTPGDEETDFKQAVRNLVAGAYKEWPNEAGVRLLPFRGGGEHGAHRLGQPSSRVSGRSAAPSRFRLWAPSPRGPRGAYTAPGPARERSSAPATAPPCTSRTGSTASPTPTAS